MYLLYADESGSPNDANQKHFVLAGISVFERQTYWLCNQLDAIAARFNPAEPAAVELHGSPMWGGKGIWRKVTKEDRYNAMKDALGLLSSHDSYRVFGCVVLKTTIVPQQPVEYAFEQVASRFDYFLKRLHKNGQSQRGLLIFDKSTYESSIQNLATNFRNIGHSWGVIRNFSEVPMFIDSKASRIIQLADLVAYSIYRKYELGDLSLYSLIENKFDNVGGIQHGLFEKV